MRDKIIGRLYECERLDDCLMYDSAQLFIIYGRTGIGKTFLINEYFDHRFAFKLTGAFRQPKKTQLESFARELSRVSGKKTEKVKDWNQAFALLRTYLEAGEDSEKQVVFFDEMPWLDTPKSEFLPAFEWFWNDWGSTRYNLVCIVCGSASAWMDEKISHNKGGLFNRQTLRLYLEPFKLFEVEAFLKSKNILLSRYELAQCYMIMGGIPYYLNLLTNKVPFSENIDRMFFKDKGDLWDEFPHLYHTLFSNSENHIKVVEALSQKRMGLTREEIIAQTGLPGNGVLTKILQNLVNSGFVRVSHLFGRKKKDSLYQLSDQYTLFYFKYIRENYGKDEHYWSHSLDQPSRRVWAGLAFEQLCKDHIPQIKQKLGISGVLTEESIWFSRGDEDLGITGAQIDLVIERRDQCINLCEMKFTLDDFVIDKDYDAVLRGKISAFQSMTKTRKAIQLTMITTYGVKRNMYSGLVQSQVTLDDLFHP